MVALVGAVVAYGAAAEAQQHVAVDERGAADARRIEALLSRPVTLDLKDVSRRLAVDAASASAKVPVQYRMQALDAYRDRITVRMRGATLRAALERILAGTSLRVTADGPTQLAIVEQDSQPQAGSAVGAAGTITGRVTDSATGRGVRGAAVQVQAEGGKRAAVTNERGEFILRGVPAGTYALAVRLFGYRLVTRDVTVRGDEPAVVQVAMASVPMALTDVVTTATGQQRRLEVGNDITVLNVDSLRQVAPIHSVTDLLEARVPGLTVLRGSGAPGDPARIRLRGVSSVTNSNDPIVVVDGIRVNASQSAVVNTAGAPAANRSNNNQEYKPDFLKPSPLDQIDPTSIETIEVMKGPSASALYGSEAANGVIVITTTRGRPGPAHWAATLAQGVETVPGAYPSQLLRWGHNYQGAPRLCAIVDIYCVVDSVRSFQLADNPRWSPFGRGASREGSVTMSGGTPALTYAVTGSLAERAGYLRLPGAIAERFRAVRGRDVPNWVRHPERYDTWGADGNVRATVRPTLAVTFASRLFHSAQRRSSLENVVPDLLALTDTTADYLSSPAHFGGGTGIAAGGYERLTSEALTADNTVALQWQPWAWLPLSGTAGMNLSTGTDESLLPRAFVPYHKLTTRLDTMGYYGVGTTTALVKTVNLTTELPLTRLRLTAATGVNYVSQSTRLVTVNTGSVGLPSGVTMPNTFPCVPGEPCNTAMQTATGSAVYGWFVEPRLNLSSRVFVTPGFRLDGGTNSGPAARVNGLPSNLSFASLFPKVNVSWLVSEEPHFPFKAVVNELRLRGAVGSAGVQPAPQDRLRLIGFSTVDAPDTANKLVIATLGNPALRPERSTELEGGFELAAVGSRVQLGFTQYRKLRHDAIIDVPTAPSLGVGAGVKRNVGVIRNTGTELTLSLTPVQTRAMSWTASGTYAHNDNRVVRLNRGQDTVLNGLDPTAVVKVGYPLFGRWARPIAGYADANGDGVIDQSEVRFATDAVYLGRPDPASTMSVNNTVTLLGGRLSVNAAFAYVGGFVQTNRNWSSYLGSAAGLEVPLALQAIYESSLWQDASGTTQDYAITQTVSQWRFNTAGVAYTVPAALTRRVGARTMTVALQGSNLALWSNYRGKDASTTALPSLNSNVDVGQLPPPRTWRLQVTLGN